MSTPYDSPPLTDAELEQMEHTALGMDEYDPWADVDAADMAAIHESTLDDLRERVDATMAAQQAPELGEISEDLTAEQRNVVETLTGRLAVVAGPGAGKTKTLVERVVNGVREGTHPGRILAVTFTRKAANEMRERLEQSLGEHVASQITTSTFHGLSGQILRGDCKKVGLDPSFEVLSGSDQKKLVKDLARQYKMPTDIDYQSSISAAKRNIELTTVGQQAEWLRKNCEHPEVSEMLRAYEQEKSRLGRLDYDDMISYAYRLLCLDEVREKWASRFDMVQVDEYQDTDVAQHAIVKLVSSKADSLMVVGDIDQSIFGWRGSMPEIFATFADDFDDAQVLYLNDNFRSTPQILNVARSTIEKVEVPHRSELRANNRAGAMPVVDCAKDQHEEARLIVTWIRNLLNRGVPYDEIAVLFRGRRHSLQLQAQLGREKIPMLMSGSVGFYERKTVKDLLAWFRLAVKSDEMSFLRIVDQTPGLGPKAAKEILEAAESEADGDIVSYLSNFVDDMTALGKGKQKRVQAVAQIHSKLSDIRTVLDARGITPALVTAASCIPAETLEKDEVDASEVSEIVDILEEDSANFIPDNPLPLDTANLVYHYAYGSGVMEAPEDGKVLVKFTNMDESHPGISFTASTDVNGEEFPVAAQVLTLDSEAPIPPAVEFLQQVSLDNQALIEEAGGAIELSTIHAAKGREWDHVAIIGLVDGLFPGGFSMDGLIKPTPEERRTMFVAESRARKSLYMTFYRALRLKDGGFSRRFPSKFLYELQEARVCDFERPLPREPRPRRSGSFIPGGVGNW